MEPSLRRGYGFALFGALMSACFLIPWKRAQQHGDASLTVLVLLVCAASYATAALLVAPREDEATPRSWPLQLYLAAAFAALSLAGNWLSALSVARISGALLAVLQRCEVIVVALLGAPLLGERVRPSYWAGTAVAALGIAWLSQEQGSRAQLDHAGVLYGVLAAVCFGAMPVLTRKHVARLRLSELNALRLWLGVLLWFVTERRVPSAAELHPQLLGNAALAALFGPFLSRTGMLLSARQLPAAMTAFVQLVIPALALVLSYVALGELPTARELQGGAVLLAGVAIPLLAQRLRSW